MTTGLPAARTNWGGVVIAVTGLVELVVAFLVGIPFPPVLSAAVHVLQVGTYLSPIALIVAFVPLTFGSRRLIGIAGPGGRSRGMVFAAVIVAAVAQYAAILLLVAQLGVSDEVSERDSSLSLTLEVFALLLGLVAGIVVARAGNVSGYALWSLIVAVVLIGTTVVLSYTNPSTGYLYWSDVPRAVGLVALGVSYWRAGLRSVPSAVPATGPSVTEESKSLAE